MGYDEDFLDVAVPMPVASAPETVTLDYTHFSVLLDRSRRLARVTGVNMDGARLVDVARSDDWRLDERIPAGWQAGPEIYAGNHLDRGHLVRRRDPVWGPDSALANSDTFHYTNAAPQASQFNQSAELWAGLENHVLDFASVNRLRLSVFTAPVLEPGDPPYRGIRVPLRFWKVAAWADADRLAAAGFVLDQTPLVDTRQELTAQPDLGPFRTFQVPIASIAALTDLAMPDLVAADRLPATVAAAGWRELHVLGDVLL